MNSFLAGILNSFPNSIFAQNNGLIQLTGVASQKIDRKATLIIAISFSRGLGVELYPEILSQFPETIKNIFSSGITTGGLAAIISNIVIRIKEE